MQYTAQTTVTSVHAKAFAAVIEAQKHNDVNGGYQMYDDAQWDEAIRVCSAATTLAPIIAVLEVPDFYSSGYVLNKLAPIILH